MPRYILILRDSGNFPTDLSPQEMQAIIERYMKWGNRLRERGALRLSEKLRDNEGKIMRRNGDKLAVTDGPFMEAREVVGGLYEVEAPDYESVVKECNDHPHLDWGTIEIREVEVLG